MEARLNKIAEYGLETLGSISSIDSSPVDKTAELSRLYNRMLAFKDSLVEGGFKKAEHIVSAVEAHYNELYDAASVAANQVADLDEDYSENEENTQTLHNNQNINNEKSQLIDTNNKNQQQQQQHNYSTIASENHISMPHKAVEGLRYIEAKLSQLETLCLESSLANQADQLNKSIQSALHAAKSRLLTYEELPVPWRDNPYIIRGYRFSKSYTDCVVSMAKIHNETCNIWTHLVGFIIMVLFAFFHYPTTLSWTNSTTMDKITMIIFLVAAMKCLVCSTVWHTFNGICHVESKQRLACVDYTGITVLIAASIITTEYAAFYCKPWYQISYMVVTAVSGMFGALFTWHPSFDSPAGKPKRVAFFVSFAAAGIMGFIHAAFLHGFADTFFFYLPVLKSLLCYGLGVVFYALFIPERWFPGGIFDYFGMSHNLWHLSVFGGIYFHYLATISLLEGAKEFSCMA